MADNLAADIHAVAGRFHRLHGICERIRWTGLGVPAVDEPGTRSALEDLSEYLFMAGIDDALARGSIAAAAAGPTPSSSSGRTPAFDAENPGSIPGEGTNLLSEEPAPGPDTSFDWDNPNGLPDDELDGSALAGVTAADLVASLQAEVAAKDARIAERERLDREAATHVEAVICTRTGFTGEPPYVGWKGIGLALTEALDERDRLRAEIAAKDAALKPFAAVADLVDIETEGFADTDEFDLMFGDLLMERFKLSDFRAARAALPEEEQG